jgi:hypothetical protein
MDELDINNPSIFFCNGPQYPQSSAIKTSWMQGVQQIECYTTEEACMTGLLGLPIKKFENRYHYFHWEVNFLRMIWNLLKIRK